MARKLKSDKVLFLATLALVAGSVVMVFSASAKTVLERARETNPFLTKQFLWSALGVAALWLVMGIDYRHYRKPRLVWLIVGATALSLLAVLFMPAVNGSRRWFGLGGLGIQPSEFAKLATIVFVAAVLERRMERIDEPLYALSPIGMAAGLFVGLILLEPDYGTAAMVTLITASMVFAAGIRWRHLVGLTLCAAPVAALVLVIEPYRRSRLLAFLNPWEDPLGGGYQIIQSLIAVGTGGLAGKGLGAGVQKLWYLPAPESDFIFAVVAEEFGLVGATVVVASFGVIAWRGLLASRRAPDAFGALLAIGLTTMIAVQAFTNVSVVLGLLPTKGIPLPFVSAGGSSLLVSMIGAGILLNVSRQGSVAT